MTNLPISRNYQLFLMKRKYLHTFIILLLFSSFTVYSQTGIRGKVIDDKTQSPLFGAVVVLKSTASGVQTNEDGTFELTSVKELPQTLSISLVGYKTQTVDVYDNNELVIVSLSENYNLLNEVVVTALGIKRERATLPYATQNISSADLNRTHTTSIASNLSGKIAGLQITSANTLGGTNNVILRGFKSLTQSNQALFIVDGVPIDNSNQSTNGLDLGNTTSDINPDDVEWIEWL